ncbi:MAG: hypothetical protein ACD_16C00137G0010 [uncultured bacterium]|nr:MAG: hypothetical protein ACD_16C00137G0010 [uncultured bacterium]OFW69005.1 MAG: hypothetical protein A2X70_02510 [Alphaproteobacteria bacterium GWC2_42_16]OFW73831.1 MAG: hypothetical protein A2Z80_04170 [Alphaproteobacteria bacterium GWA2_41_27]OFW82174.1 MAG: hypothetical protein A3E50_00210 [Alphaproteobacteria bacterium RIFCSPHIGHO2_12_FULL_42_100]OFW86375.1 MAG: hypothetical protein A2W06_02270 [Alphaproteobacteria bacterium RBG_16_42_14]OFW91269.1 MAG: hypothetical protein A3C41_063
MCDYIIFLGRFFLFIAFIWIWIGPFPAAAGQGSSRPLLNEEEPLTSPPKKSKKPSGLTEAIHDLKKDLRLINYEMNKDEKIDFKKRMEGIREALFLEKGCIEVGFRSNQSDEIAYEKNLRDFEKIIHKLKRRRERNRLPNR